MSVECTSPRFPPEIERDIFELTARAHRETAVKLTLVARRVQIWIEKVIYEVVALSDRRKCMDFLHTIDSRPADFFETHVKAICLPYFLDSTQASRILSLCPKVEDLGCWAQQRPIQTLRNGHTHADHNNTNNNTGNDDKNNYNGNHNADLSLAQTPIVPRPRRLSVNIRDLFQSPTGPDFKHPLFANITHLRVVDGWTTWTTWSDLHLIPCLTHLALDFSGIMLTNLARVTPALTHILEKCEKLEVCVLYTNKFELVATQRALGCQGVKDARVVVLAYSNPLEGWEAGVRGRASHWEVAESVLRSREAEAPRERRE